jgi:hypothetical protein
MKTNLPLLAAAGTTVLAFGLCLSLGSPFSEEKPSQIKNIECTEYQFSWYDAEIGDSVISTAWEFKPSQLPSLNDLISKSDTTWSFTDEDGKSNVYWSKDITVQALYKADTLNKVMVYWSEEF